MTSSTGENISEQAPRLPVWKKVVYGLVSTVVIFLVLAVAGEIGLRVVSLFIRSFKSAPFRQYDPQIGLLLMPNKHLIHSRGCFTGEISTNRWSMRDRDRSLEKPPGEFRIALIGDSLVEGAHVKPSEVMNIQMEDLLHQQGYNNIEVLAFAVEGIGTSQEFLMYEDHVRQFHPDMVVVVWADNDVMNNSSVIQPRVYGIHTWYAPYFNLGPDGQLVFQPVAHRPFNGLQSFLEAHSLLTYYVERTWQRVDISPAKWEGIPLEFGVYGDPPDKEWSDAWTVSEKVLRMMNDTVHADGAQFMLFVAPGFFEIDPNWRAKVEKQLGPLPPNMDVDSMHRRLAAIGQRDGVAVEFMAPDLIAYRDSHNLQWPYFSMTCDAHFSPLGHHVVAEIAIDKLKQRHFLPPHPGSGG